jgi:dihydropteroate synthase
VELSPDSEKKNGKIYGLDLNTTQIMGVLNVTPDSFSDGGQFVEVDKAVIHALQMEEDGAVIIDVGGESSRPGADPVSEEEELSRVIPVIDGIRKNSQILISIDTTKSRVADSALQVGANWINDISGLRTDPEMMVVASDYDCPVVVMHMKGTPQTMQENPTYNDVCQEINLFFEERIATLSHHGVNKIILDPGIGFGKRLEDNLTLISRCDSFQKHGLPVLAGPSRKSFIGMITGHAEDQRLAGTLAAVHVLVQKGVNILRVHDVRETRDFLQVLDALGVPSNRLNIDHKDTK